MPRCSSLVRLVPTQISLTSPSHVSIGDVCSRRPTSHPPSNSKHEMPIPSLVGVTLTLSKPAALLANGPLRRRLFPQFLARLRRPLRMLDAVAGRRFVLVCLPPRVCPSHPVSRNFRNRLLLVGATVFPHSRVETQGISGRVRGRSCDRAGQHRAAQDQERGELRRTGKETQKRN